ncbi:MAG TPA: hypothetical protein VFM18_23270 [Methanosarcina sp.]|nr:hypothetical protein [Methanosarcina sp.]
MALSNVDRFNQTLEDTYIFKSPTGERLTYLGPSTSVTPQTNSQLFSFIYVTYPGNVPTTTILDVNDQLAVIYVNKVLDPNWNTTPSYISYEFSQVEFSVAISFNDP